MTLPEVLLWQRLRRCGLGFRVRRQHPIGPYVADFYCPSARLVIEVDGERHGFADVADHDHRRDEYLRRNGYHVLRITAADVLRDRGEAVAGAVARAVSPLHHASHGPPPLAGEE